MRKVLRSLLIGFGFLWAALSWAHAPFDNSVRLIVHDEQLEGAVTMGMEAAKQFLSAAGLAPERIVSVLTSYGAGKPQQLSPELAKQLMELTAGGRTLSAGSLTVASDGLEATFSALYERPAGSTVDFRAMYFKAVTSARQGSLVVLDENMNQLGAAIISGGNQMVSLALGRGTIQNSDEWGRAVPAPESRLPVGATLERSRADAGPSAREFFRLGVSHILTGFDHLLFLFALLIGVRRLGPLLGIITCFTVAHSVTLALAALNVVTVSNRVIEPLIAASIIAVGLTNLWRSEPAAERYWLAGGFGLLHGFGFAAVLRESGLGAGASGILLPLFSFNLGVEAGQLMVASLAVPCLLVLGKSPALTRYLSPALSAGIILMSSYWLLERTFFVR